MNNKRQPYSVIIITYKGRSQLKHCLRSAVESFDSPSDEIIVTEDGEDHATAAIVNSFQSLTPPKVIHVTQPDTGNRVSEARNRGVLASSNERLLFLDHDIVLPKGFSNFLARYHREGWVTGGRRFFLNEDITRRLFLDSSKRINPFAWNTKIRAIISRWEGWRYLLPLRDRTPGKTPQDWRFTASFCFAISRSDFLKVDGFDSRYDGIFGVEDWDLYTRLDHAGVKFGYLPFGATVAHLHHKRSDHDLQSRNYKFLEQVISERRTQAVSGITKLV